MENRRNNRVFERIEKLLSDQGKTQRSLLESLGMNRATYGNWKSGRSVSYVAHIGGIAEFFGVSPDYLLRGTEEFSEERTRTPAENEMLELFRMFKPSRQESLIHAMLISLSKSYD